MQTITVIGSINVDHVLRVPYFPEPGETLTGREYRQFPGGKGANQAVAVARSGAPCRFIACVGDDNSGRQLLEDYSQQGIDVSAITCIEDCSTGVAMIQVNDQGENTIALASGANSALSVQLISRHLGAPEPGSWMLMSLETPLLPLQYAAECWDSGGGLVALNPAPAQHLDPHFLRHVHLITPNETEARILTGVTVSDAASAREAAAVLHQKGIPQVIITMGSQGVWASDSGRGQMMPAFTVQATDTTAAGDTFNGYLISALSQGMLLDDAVQLAQKAAALSVTRPGAQSSIPLAGELEHTLPEASGA